MLTLLIALFLGQFSTAAFANDGGLTFPARSDEPVELNLAKVKAIGNQTELSDILQVFVGKRETCCENRTPIAGHYEKDGGVVRFMPVFEFVEGQDYVVRVDQSSHNLTEFRISPKTSPEPTQVTRIYPSGDLLPENVLRFYIHFSKPMKPHIAADYIKLVDASGSVDDAAFMRFKQELWSEDRKRLTLLMDPGRIKRNVSTNLRLGPALRKDQNYTLVIEEGWPAANGEQKLLAYKKPFLISEALRELPSIDKWDIEAPEFGTKGALEIRFDRPFDHQLLQTDIKVVSEVGVNIPGEVIVEDHETTLRFLPKDDWADKRVFIVVDSELEDVAGNNFRDLLDHKIEIGTKQIRSTSVAVDLLQSN